MSLDVMKQALAALEWNLPVIEDYGDHEQLGRQHRAITALRAAIEQAQELVCVCGAIWEGQDLVSAPLQRKPLSEQEILGLLPDAQHGWTTAFYGKWVARAVERAHGIKENT